MRCELVTTLKKSEISSTTWVKYPGYATVIGKEMAHWLLGGAPVNYCLNTDNENNNRSHPVPAVGPRRH